MQKNNEPTPIDGIRYFQPKTGYRLTGRDDLVNIPLDDLPLPLQTADYAVAEEQGEPDYDQVGNGIYHALRYNPDCHNAARYADLLQQAYPHIIAEIGGEIIMLDAKEVDVPYLDRKVALLRIMALISPENAGLWRETGRTLMERGNRLEATHLAVKSWFGAEKFLAKSLELEPDDLHTVYQYGEVHYMLGHYDEAVQHWQGIIDKCSPDERKNLEERIAAIKNNTLPRVPPVDYLTALAAAFELYMEGELQEAAAIVEDVLADQVFSGQFSPTGIRGFLDKCHGKTEAGCSVKGHC